MESCSNEKRFNKSKYILYLSVHSSHHFSWWQLCTLLAFSQPASPGMLFQPSWSSSHICWAYGCFSFTLRSNSPQTFSIGFRSGDCGGQVICCSNQSLFSIGYFAAILPWSDDSRCLRWTVDVEMCLLLELCEAFIRASISEAGNSNELILCREVTLGLSFPWRSSWEPVSS